MGESLFSDGARYSVNSWGCKFTVFGEARPGGSKALVPRIRKYPVLVTSAKHYISLGWIREDNVKVHDWRKEIAIVAGTIMKGRNPWEGPVQITVDFYQKRPAGHFGTKGLKPSAPRFPTKRPDATKLLRPAEDAMKGILWIDDSQVVEQHVRKFYGEPPRMEFSLLVML